MIFHVNKLDGDKVNGNKVYIDAASHFSFFLINHYFHFIRMSLNSFYTTQTTYMKNSLTYSRLYSDEFFTRRTFRFFFFFKLKTIRNQIRVYIYITKSTVRTSEANNIILCIRFLQFFFLVKSNAYERYYIYIIIEIKKKYLREHFLNQQRLRYVSLFFYWHNKLSVDQDLKRIEKFNFYFNRLFLINK